MATRSLKVLAVSVALTTMLAASGTAAAQAPGMAEIQRRAAESAALSQLSSGAGAGRRPEDLTYLKKRAERGDAEAQYELAGKLASSDIAAAVRWCRAAADQGNAAAQNTL